MRVPFSRWMAFAVTAICISAMTSTGCTTMGRAPGVGWMTSWWHKEPTESYASHTPRPSERSTPTLTTSLGNASEPPRDPTITPYDSSGNLAQSQAGGGYPLSAQAGGSYAAQTAGPGGYPTQPAGAIQPNYATANGNGSATSPYGAAGSGYGTSYQGSTGTQVAPAGGNSYGGGSSVYAGAAPQTNPYTNPYSGAGGTQTADARNSYGGTSAAPNYGSPVPSNSAIQPYNGSYQGGSSVQPYGNPTPPPSYNPPASGSYQPAGSYSGGGYNEASTAPLSQPPTDGYTPGSVSRYEANRQQPAPVEGAADLYGDQSVTPAGYQQVPSASSSQNPYGGYTPAGTGGSYPYP